MPAYSQPTTYAPHMDRAQVEALMESGFFMEPAILTEDIDVANMRASVRLKRKLVTGAEHRVHAPDWQVLQKSDHGQEADSVGPIYICPVMFFKTRIHQNRVRYKKDDDVVLLFSQRAKDKLIAHAHQTEIDPHYKRSHHIQDAWVLLGFLCDEGEPKMPASSGRMDEDSFVLVYGREGESAAGCAVYANGEGDIVVQAAPDRTVYIRGKDIRLWATDSIYFKAPKLYWDIDHTWERGVRHTLGASTPEADY